MLGDGQVARHGLAQRPLAGRVATAAEVAAQPGAAQQPPPERARKGVPVRLAGGEVEGGRGSGDRDQELVLGQGGTNVYSILDSGPDDFDGLLDINGRPVNTFVSGDGGLDFSTVSHRLLG